VTAIFGNNAKIVKVLLDNGADMNTKDSLGRTVFHYAYMCGNPDIIAMLQDHRYLKQSINDESTIRSWNIK
jgi:ankyrin repeat protein